MDEKNLKGYELLGIVAVGAILILSVLISGCVEEKPPINETENKTITQTEKKTKTWVDYFNRTVEVPIHPQRIIALSKADTEILFTMGLGNRMVGRCYYCDSPSEALKLTDCGSISKPNFEAILNLSPDLVILYTTGHGITEKNYEDIVGRFEKYNLAVVINPPYPYTIYEVMDYIKNDGKLVGEEERAEKVVEEMNKKLNFVKEEVKNLKDNEKPTVAKINPPYGEKLFASGLSFPIEDAGGINVFNDLKSEKYRSGDYINPESLLDKNPDVIIISYMDYSKELLKGKTKEEIENDVMKKMEKVPGWNKLKAVKNNRICVIDGYKTYGTPRVADGLIEVAQCIHPELFGKQTEKKTKTWIDAFNRTVEVPVHPKRIITLDKADTEILFTMGLEDRVIGRGYYCDVPHDALKLTDCGSPWNPNFEVILNLSPDLVILQRCCESYYKKNYEDIDKRFEKYNLTLVVMPSYPNDIYEVIDYIKYEGKLIGEEEKAEKIIEEMNKKLNFVKEKVKNLKDNEKPTVAIVWPPYGEKLFVWKISPIETAGGINVFKDLKGNYDGGDYINPETLLDKDPDVIIVTHVYYDKDILKGKTKDEIERDVIKNMEKIPGWNKLKAVKNNRVCVINSYEHVGSPRVADGLIKIAKCIHPELFGAKKETITFTDDLNRTVEIPKNPKRIVTLDSGVVEFLFALNASDKLVGRPTYATYPKEALKITDCGGIFKPNFEVIVNLTPDVVTLTWIKGQYADIVKRFENYNVTVVGFDWPNSIPALINYYKKLGKITGMEKEIESLIENMTTEMERITNITSKLDESQKPKVFIEMKYTKEKKGIKTYGREANLKTPLVEAAGGKNVFADIKGFEVSSEEVIKKNPDIIIIVPSDTAFSKDEYDKLKEEIKNRPGWSAINAVKNDKICVISSSLADTNPRIAQGLEEYAKCIHPELFGNKSSNQ